MVLLSAGELLKKDSIDLLKAENIEEIKIRNPLICNSISGVCQKCYGMDLSTREMVQIGIPVGINASQSIG